jgi:hypothetical protein
MFVFFGPGPGFNDDRVIIHDENPFSNDEEFWGWGCPVFS